MIVSCQVSLLLTGIIASDQWQEDPVFPGDLMAQRLLIVEHPSLRDINQTISKKTYEIEYNQDEEFRSVKKQIEARDADPDNFFVDPRDERYKKKLDYINLLKEQRD
jgi:hypothetical protein